MSEDIVKSLTLVVLVIWNVYQAYRNKTSDQSALLKDQADAIRELDELRARIFGLETKVGLFWHLVEEHMTNMLPHGNPIHLDLDEQMYARVYNTYKAKAPTHVLKALATGVARELRDVDQEGKHKYMSADEIVAFTCILGAIKSQLFDRGEWRPEDD